MSENKARVATIVRETGESRIAVTVNLDGTGQVEVATPIGFLKHMLNQIAKHGLIDLKVEANGDIETGSHHIVEDTAIVLGRAIDQALGDRKGIVRMADRTCPLDEALTQAVIDLSGRGYAVINMASNNNVGEFPADMARHFFEAMAVEGRFCLHIRVLAGQNEHHVIESSFKAFARALRDASQIDQRNPDGIPSTKGTLTD
ncbi:MAG: imidazoleglycerol-phosphate dehydratase HisB [Chloroflexi bacterium]|mgnify:CR=1 FL=1|nr:imidazoleglycerol-phosphate dehydratase HisB [Chloroflexota bacterium]